VAVLLLEPQAAVVVPAIMAGAALRHTLAVAALAGISAVLAAREAAEAVEVVV
jgi:hypothetical protein